MRYNVYVIIHTWCYILLRTAHFSYSRHSKSLYKNLLRGQGRAGQTAERSGVGILRQFFFQTGMGVDHGVDRGTCFPCFLM